jgi:hypothetical protein
MKTTSGLRHETKNLFSIPFTLILVELAPWKFFDKKIRNVLNRSVPIPAEPFRNFMHLMLASLHH